MAPAGKTDEIHRRRHLEPPLPTPSLTTCHLLRVLRASCGAAGDQYYFKWSFLLSYRVLPLSQYSRFLAFYSFVFLIHIRSPHPVPLCPSKSFGTSCCRSLSSPSLDRRIASLPSLPILATTTPPELTCQGLHSPDFEPAVCPLGPQDNVQNSLRDGRAHCDLEQRASQPLFLPFPLHPPYPQSSSHL